jgi:hypothetical protein
VISAVVLYAASSRFERTNPVASYFTVWILATAFLTAWLRGAIASRYSIYSLLLLVFCYSFLARYLRGRSLVLNPKRFYATSLVLAIAFCFLSDLSAYKHLLMRREMVLSGIDHYRENPEVNSPNIDPVMARYDSTEADIERVTLTRALQQHVYTLPAAAR